MCTLSGIMIRYYYCDVASGDFYIKSRDFVIGSMESMKHEA